MAEPNYDAALWAAADRYMSGNGAPEGEVSFTVERAVAELPEVLRHFAVLCDGDECVELMVECEVDDTDAIVTGVYVPGETKPRKVPHIVIPLTRQETEWTREVAISAEERRRDAYEADAYDRWADR